MTCAEPRDRMLAGLPPTRKLDISGISTAIVESGDGPPLLLLHGGIECGGAMWAPVIAPLARHHRVVVPDVPGLGESGPVRRLDAEVFARWLRGLIEEAGVERPIVVAHSLVGGLALRSSTSDGVPMSRLVVYAAPAVGPYRMPLRLRYVAVRFAMHPSRRNAERFDRFALHDLVATRRRDPDWFDAFQAYTLARAAEPHVQQTMRRLVASQTKQVPDAELDRIRIPTTLLWGRHDRMVPLRVGETASARHGWPLRVIDGAAHAPHIEQPEAFVEALTAQIGSTASA